MPLGMVLVFIRKPHTHTEKTAHSSYRQGGSPFTKESCLTFLVASTLFLILIHQVVAPEAAHPFCKGNIIILFIFHVQTFQTWGGSPNQTRKRKVKCQHQANSLTLFCQQEEEETQFQPLFLHSIPQNPSHCTPGHCLNIKSILSHLISTRFLLTFPLQRHPIWHCRRGLVGREMCWLLPARCCWVHRLSIPMENCPQLHAWEVRTWTQSRLVISRSGIDILTVVRNWHSCLRRPNWLCGREDKWPALPMLSSLLTSVVTALPSVFMKCGLSRWKKAPLEETACSFWSYDSQHERASESFHLPYQGYGRPCLTWRHRE